MKALSTTSSLMILALALLVSGCGGAGKTSASLQVVNGFLVSANGFDGGLIIYGKKDTGEEISVTLTNSLTTTLELPNGNWIFRAVGWEGDNSDLTMKFSNIPRCGYNTATLNGGDLSLTLKMDAAGCDSDQFAALGYRNSGSFREFGDFLTTKSLVIEARPGDRPDLKKITAAASSSTVINNLPPDMVSSAKSVRVFALKKELGKDFENGFYSKCMSATNGVANKSAPGAYGARNFRLPTRGVPLRVEMYKNSDCSELISGYNFPKGFENPSDGDFLFHVETPSNLNRLVLVATDLKKGYSPFYGHLPYVKCYTSGEVPCDTVPGGTVPKYVINNSSSETISIKDGKTCTSPSVSGSPSITVTSCTNTTDGFDIVLNASTAITTTAYSLSNAGVSYPLGVITNSAPDRKKYAAYTDMIRGVGPSNFANYPRTFIRDNDDEEENRIAYGRLGRVREHLSSAGAMGLFGLVDETQTYQYNCQNTAGTKEVTLTDENGVKETMRVVVTSVNLAAPDTYTCSITAPAATSCPGITYEKKIQVYNLSKSSSVPEMTYAIDCDSLQGKFESAELGSIQGSKKYDNRQIVSWNTNPDSSLSFQRYEFLDLNKEYQLIGTTWTTIGEWREMGRVFKTALNKVQFLNFSFGTHTDDGTNWQQQLDARSTLLIPSASIACIDNKSQAFTNVDPTYVLTAGSTIASYRTTQVAATSTADEMNYNSAFNTAAVSAATTTCTSTYVLDALPAANNNDQINKSLVPEVNSLADGMMDAEFGSFLGI